MNEPSFSMASSACRSCLFIYLFLLTLPKRFFLNSIVDRSNTFHNSARFLHRINAATRTSVTRATFQYNRPMFCDVLNGLMLCIK